MAKRRRSARVERERAMVEYREQANRAVAMARGYLVTPYGLQRFNTRQIGQMTALLRATLDRAALDREETAPAGTSP